MTLGNSQQPLTRRQLRELAAQQAAATDAEAGKPAAPVKRMVRPTAPQADRQPAASFTELIEQVPRNESSGFAPRAPKPQSQSPASAFKRPTGEPADMPERTLTRRELREMMAAKTAEAKDEVEPDPAPANVDKAPVIPALDPVQQVLRPAAAPRPLLADAPAADAEAKDAEPFDQLISRGSSVSVTTSNTLILPSIPQQPTSSAMSMTGEVLITGSIDLPRGLGSTGAPPDRFDTAEVDRLLDQADESPTTSNVAPVSASRAVSTHTSTRGVMTPPKKHVVSLPMVLAITAGVLLVGVVTLFAAGYLFHIF